MLYFLGAVYIILTIVVCRLQKYKHVLAFVENYPQKKYRVTQSQTSWKSWKDHGTIMERSWKDHEKYTKCSIIWILTTFLESSWKAHGKFMERSWKDHGKIMERSCFVCIFQYNSLCCCSFRKIFDFVKTISNKKKKSKQFIFLICFQTCICCVNLIIIHVRVCFGRCLWYYLYILLCSWWCD